MLETSSNIVRYDGNGVTDEFDYPFLIFQASDLKVYVDGALVSNSNYTIDGVGVEAGGTVTFTVSPGSGTENVVLERVAAFTQPVSIAEGSKFPASIVESAHDRNTMLSQQLDSRVNRCVQLNVAFATSADDLTLSANAATRATKVIAFDADGTGLTLVSGGGAAEAEIFAQAAANSAANAAQSASDAANSYNAMVTLSGTISDLLNAAISGFVTGDVKISLKTTAVSGWVFMNDGTIGSAASGATNRANADTEDLYTLLWDGYNDEYFPVTGGRGASAAADFAANKPMRLGYAVGRAMYAAGTGQSFVEGVDGDVDTSLDTFTVPSNVDTWITGMAVTLTLASGTITGLTSGNVYYVIRNSATTIKLASTTLNAQNGTAINLTAKSSPVWSLSHAYAARPAGSFWGEQIHAPSASEVAPHSHSHSHSLPGVWKTGGGSNNPSGSGTSTPSGGVTAVSAVVAGGGVYMPLATPGFGVHVLIKL